ncbi:uncharacterized protein At2g33490-like isoform X2 [Diospyros lotus]|uniref:uncharacterized protein At2g33490-like isoform X2 n=1 Tax=Diospyros lotus TaxID=55363 RepID=UPI0022588296|nr:uncharacterized protein At2g33490-like isoform X2 [Diospyros lotus]
MRNSFRKLRSFALQRHGDTKDRKDRRFGQLMPQMDELARASQDMQDMKDCYDSLLSAAAATANSAYEFSESLREMGTCLLEKTGLNDDEESGKVLLMLAKLQFELQRLVDNYRSHISQTITSPSESLLNELRIVEEMKRQRDEKRSAYEYMITRYREKGRMRSNKGESFSSQQVQAAYDEYDEEATLFMFRLKSLKQGQLRSLLTQATRHHAAQQHIDYQFPGLEDDDGENDDSDNNDNDDEDGSYSVHDYFGLSFDHGRNEQGQKVPTSRDSMEESLDRNPGRNSFANGRDQKTSSQSEPLPAEKEFDPAERFRQIRPLASRKSHSYVLPTPVERKSPVSMVPNTQVSQARRASSVDAVGFYHSSPLEREKNTNALGNENFSGPNIHSPPTVLRESDSFTPLTSLTPPLVEDLSSQRVDLSTVFDAKKIRRQAFSGPLTSKASLNKPGVSASTPLISRGPSNLLSGPRMPQPLTSPKLSPSASPTFVASPKISELHQLPRPPTNSASYMAGRASNKVGHSGPLVSIGHEVPAANKLAPNVVTLLPTPPLTISRSFSTPSRGTKGTTSLVSLPLGASLAPKRSEDIASPPLTPISFPSTHPGPTA